MKSTQLQRSLGFSPGKEFLQCYDKLVFRPEAIDYCMARVVIDESGGIKGALYGLDLHRPSQVGVYNL
jgi:hypothetical protein